METDDRVPRTGVAVFSLALGLRVVAVLVTTLTGLNTYATYDADSFSRHAARIATAVTQGQLPAVNIYRIDDLWGLFLSPFWLLPGPSRFYARLGSAVLGAIAVYNVYVVARDLHSDRAGAGAAIPMIAFPSFLFVHSTVLREAAVLVGITTAARLLIAPPPRLGTGARWSLAAACLYVASVLRADNVPVYLLTIAVAVAVRYRSAWRSMLVKAVTGLALIVGTVVVWVDIRSVIDFLARLRRKRARGRTEYLPDVIPDTLASAVAFSWIGAAYFLYTPFPWMITGPALLVTGLESVVTIAFTYFAFTGVRHSIRRSPAVTSGLVVGFLVIVTLYGLATANVGTAIRHRQMFTWVLFVYGGIGLALSVSDVVFRSRSDDPSSRTVPE